MSSHQSGLTLETLHLQFLLMSLRVYVSAPLPTYAYTTKYEHRYVMSYCQEAIERAWK